VIRSLAARTFVNHSLSARIFAVAVAIGAALRLSDLGQVMWQYDEIVYRLVATNLVQHGLLTEKANYLQPDQEFLYQPPWYPHLLAGWFRLTSPTIYQARVLGELLSVGTLALTWFLVRRLAGNRIATIATIPLVFDGWLLYIQRISYIENLILLVVVAGLFLYQRAVDRPSWWRFLAAGLVLGAAGCLKFTGIYVLIAVALSWLILQREHAGHVIALSTAVAVIGLDQVYLVLRYGGAYLSETAVQIRRVFGLQQSSGSVSSLSQLIHLLLRQYDVFIPSLLIAMFGLVIAIRLLWRCYRARDWVPARPQALLFAWSAAGVVTFGLSSVRFPQYFALVLVPLYLLFWTTISERLEPAMRYAAVSLACAAGVFSWVLSADAHQINPFQRTEQYVAAHLAPSDVVVADEQIGDLIPQPYCREEQATASCLRKASYVITWDTYLQQTQKLGDKAFEGRFQGATRVWSVTGFSGTATVWKLAEPTAPKAPVAPRALPIVGIDVAATQNYSPAQTRAYGRRLLRYIRGTLHANALGIVFDLCNPSFNHGPVTRCAQSLQPQDVRVLAEQAARQHLAVQVRPLIRVGPPARWNNPARSWEGLIRPDSAATWLAGLSKAEEPYLAAVRGIPHAEFVLGTELRRLQDAPEWPALVRKSKAACGCAVSVDIWDHYYLTHRTPPVSDLGTDWYPDLALRASASQAQVTAAFERSLSGVSPAVLAHTSLDETSIRATVGAYRDPANWNIAGPPAPQVQERYFTAACQTAARYGMKGIWFYFIPLDDNPAAPFRFPAYFVGNAGAKAIAQCAALRQGEVKNANVASSAAGHAGRAGMPSRPAGLRTGAYPGTGE
jgi:hypothetical protein